MQMQKRHQFENVRGLYIHIPFCTGKCFYCAFYSLPYKSGLAQKYLRALKTELKEYPRLKVETIYFGGGTPAVFSAPELQDLCSLVKENLCLTNLREWTVETNPESLTPDKLTLLAGAGVNRISLGAQSFNNDVLKWLGRRHSSADIHEAVHMIRTAGFDNFGLDLIACVPGFGRNVWRDTLQSAVALTPKHISVYALTAEEGSRLAGAVDSTPQINLLSEDEELEMLALAENILINEGYQRYEISNYAKKGYECQHNLACWRGEEYIGLGAAAASHAGLKRWINESDLAQYVDALEHGKNPPRATDILDGETKQIEKIVFGLRMAEGVSADDGGICLNALRRLQNEGLLKLANGRWRLTGRGKNLADYAGAELFAGVN